jgi:hypothetical protein
MTGKDADAPLLTASDEGFVTTVNKEKDFTDQGEKHIHALHYY